jgi:hypothetical protein
MADRRRKQAAHINQHGFDVMPCSRCAKHGLPCRMSRGSKKCSSCVSANRPCEGNAVPLDSLDRIGAALDRIEAEDAEAEEKLAELLARRSRLRKQRLLLQEKGVKMLEKGAKDLDELEEMERREAEEAASAVPPASTSAIPSFPAVDWSIVDWSVLLQEPLAPTSGSGTAAEVSGSSQGG